MFRPGDKVHYSGIGIPGTQNGIIKSLHPVKKDRVFVVYHCFNDWENYKLYTAELTKLEFLKEGWIEEQIRNT